MFFPVALFLVAFPFLAQASSSKDTLKAGLPIPLSKYSPYRNNDFVNVTKLQASRHHSIAKIERGLHAFERNTGGPHPLASKPGHLAKRLGNVSLTDFEASMWYGPMSVGTPGLTFTVLFDTGSSDCFLFDISCDATCHGHESYNPNRSSTVQYVGNPVNLTYGGGSWAFVEQYTDTVSLGGYKATRQALGSATSTSGLDTSSFPADGLLGMAFQSISTFQAPPIFQTLVAQGQVSQPVFAFYLAPSGSELFIGGTNSDHYTGSFTYVPVDKQGYWQISFDSIMFDRKTFLGKTSVVVDTGTTQVLGDTNTVQAIYDLIPGSAAVGEGTWTFPCDTNVTVSITFGGTEFAISPDTFNLGPEPGGSPNSCVGGIGADDDITFWVVGDVFLQNVYTVFDYGNNQVGFAFLPASP